MQISIIRSKRMITSHPSRESILTSQEDRFHKMPVTESITSSWSVFLSSLISSGMPPSFFIAFCQHTKNTHTNLVFLLLIHSEATALPNIWPVWNLKILLLNVLRSLVLFFFLLFFYFFLFFFFFFWGECTHKQLSYSASKPEESSLPYCHHWPCQRTGFAERRRHFCELLSSHDSAAGSGDGCHLDLWNMHEVFLLLGYLINVMLLHFLLNTFLEPKETQSKLTPTCVIFHTVNGCSESGNSACLSQLSVHCHCVQWKTHDTQPVFPRFWFSITNTRIKSRLYPIQQFVFQRHCKTDKTLSS